MSAFFWLPYQSNTFLMEKSSFVHSLLQVLSKATVIMHGNIFQATVQMGFLKFKLLIFISPTLQWHILTPS